jgi:hypothetical protein
VTSGLRRLESSQAEKLAARLPDRISDAGAAQVAEALALTAATNDMTSKAANLNARGQSGRIGDALACGVETLPRGTSEHRPSTARCRKRGGGWRSTTAAAAAVRLWRGRGRGHAATTTSWRLYSAFCFRGFARLSILLISNTTYETCR